LNIKTRNELILLNLLVFALIAVIIFLPPNILRIILGIPFLIFIPGYVLTAVFFPKKESIDSAERVALSFGLSIPIVGFIALILNYTPWGITLESILYSTASFIFVSSIIAGARRKRLPEEERFGVEFRLGALGWGEGPLNKVLSVIFVLAILVVLGALGYIVAVPKAQESFTEFYVLGLEGKTIDYPNQLVIGEEGRVIVGIINREHETVSYRVEVRIDGVNNNGVEPIVLEHNEKWEEEVSFMPQEAGGNQKLEFLLYKSDEAEPILKPLHLWLDVSK